MVDLLFIGLTLGFFTLCFGLIRFFDSLAERGDS
jgi:hypothetical protein